MDSSVLGSDEVVTADCVFWEVNGQTTCFDERHATVFLLDFSATVHIFLVRVCLSFELLQLSEFEPLFHRPLDDSAIS